MGEKPVPPLVGDSVSVSQNCENDSHQTNIAHSTDPPTGRGQLAPPNALTGVGSGFRRLHQWYMRDRLRAQQSRTTIIEMDDGSSNKTTNRPQT